MSERGKPLPRISAEARPYWDACREGELRYQACRGCGKVQFYPRALCAGCGGTDLEWCRSAGSGVVHAVTVVYRAPSEPFRADVPYAVALVDLDEGFRMMANVVGGDPERVAIGDRVRVLFETRGEVALPQFTPVEAGGSSRAPSGPSRN